MLKTRLKLGAAFLALCAFVGTTPTCATAQDRQGMTQNTADRDDDGFDLGWLGLLGLVGLAGLAGRNRNHAHHETTRQDTAARR